MRLLSLNNLRKTVWYGRTKPIGEPNRNRNPIERPITRNHETPTNAQSQAISATLRTGSVEYSRLRSPKCGEPHPNAFSKGEARCPPCRGCVPFLPLEERAKERRLFFPLFALFSCVNSRCTKNPPSNRRNSPQSVAIQRNDAQQQSPLKCRHTSKSDEFEPFVTKSGP